MRSNFIVAVLTAILAIGAGVAIAGLPSTTPGANLRVTEIPTISTTAAASPRVASIPNTTVPSTTSGDTTPVATSLTPFSTEPANTTSTAPSTTDVNVVLLRSQLRVATANATAQSGVAGEAVDAVRAFGYVDIRPVDAQPSNTSAVFYAPGLEEEAVRLANDLLFEPEQIAPMADMPALQTDLTFDLVAVIGLDRV